jgi:hypothetical protein
MPPVERDAIRQPNLMSIVSHAASAHDSPDGGELPILLDGAWQI